MKSRNFWAVLCLFALFALPAVAQDWALKQMITLPEKTIFSFTTKTVKVDGNNLLVADAKLRKVFFFENIANSWVYQQTILPENGSNTEIFGKSLDIQGDYAVIGASPTNLFSPASSYVYIFKKNNGSWQQIQKIHIPASSDCVEPNIGENVLFYGDYIFISSFCEGALRDGAICVYKKNLNSETWSLHQKIKCWDQNFYFFGQQIQIKDDYLIVKNSSGSNDDRYVYKNFTENITSASPNWVMEPYNHPIYFGEEGYIENKSSKEVAAISSTQGSGSPAYIRTYAKVNNNWKIISTTKTPYLTATGPGSGQGHNTLAHNDNVLLQGCAMLNFVRPQYQEAQKFYGFRIFKRIGKIWILEEEILPINTSANRRTGEQMTILDDRNILISGYQINNANPLDSVSVIYHFQKTRGNFIKGKVYHDVNANCQKEAGEVGKEYYVIKAEPGGYITSTDENGNYELEVGAGTYTISQVIPQAKGMSVTQLCPTGAGTHTVTFNGLNNEVSGYDFGNDVKECTLLTVDVTSRRRRCFRNQTIVKYENEGVATANNAYITVTFPEYVIPLSSTNPWVSKVGNTYKFNVGTLTAGQRGQFVVTDSVACVTGIVGLIQCTEAKIYPKNTCASPTWSGASLEIVGKCLNVAPHKGRFVLRNTGTASMQSSYKVWRGNSLILNNLLTLAQGDSLVLEIPTNNENLFIQANQATGHPDGETVSAMVMNCGNDLPTSAGSPNLQMMILPNDEYANSELDCMPIVDSYDPNDKAVSPAGITENNYVKPNTELEYKIRFQNMGTAEAVNIVVIDTLSTHLDLTTFQMMSASHTYKLKFERVNGKQVAFWTFTDINLPAKSVNEPASHGYIKFKIKHLPTIAEGTIIKNFADIYFDFNEPVRTNETAINMTDYQFPVNPVDYCSLFTQAQAGQARTVCGDSYTLEGNLPTMGQGTWTRISGAGEIAEPHKSNSLVTNLGVGENVFRWTLAGVPDCANTQSQVTIKRLPTATVSISNNTSNNIACAEETITFSAQTNNVGNAPVYQWKVNNQNVGTNSPTFNTNTLQNQDKVSVEVQTNLDCINTPKITSQSIEMTIKAKPAKPVISHTSLYELNSSVEGDSYAWYKDNVLITNNLPTLKVQKLGKYKVVVTKNGCTSPTSDELVLNSEALKNFADLVKVETYPNPTTGKFTLNVINNQGSEVTVQFYNSLGQLLTEQRVEASEDIDCKVSIDFTRYKQGVYYAKIINQYGLQTTQKIVIQKQ